MRYVKFVAMAVAVVAMISCAHQPSAIHHHPSPITHHPSPITHHPSPLTQRYNYFFLEAIRQQTAGNYDAAFDLLQHAIDINPQASEAWYYMSMYQSEIGKDSHAKVCLERAAAINPSNDTYQEQLAQFYLSLRQYDLATAVYERLATNNPNRLEVHNMLIQLYRQDKNYDGMIRSIERLERIEGPREETTLAKMQVYEMMGDKKKAWRTLKSLADEHPNDANLKVMMGNWLMQNDKQKEAGKLFLQTLKFDPDNAYAQSSLYDYYRITGNDSLARKMLNDIVVSDKSSSEMKSVMMRQAIQDNEQSLGDSTDILNLFDRILLANPKDSDMAEMRVAYMTLKKMPTDSINTALRRLLAISPENAGARLQLLGDYLHAQDWDNVIDICHSGTQYSPDEMIFYYYEGLAYYQQDRRDEAYGAFQRGVAQIKEGTRPEIVADLYYFMGDLLHQKDRDEEAFAAYDSCLQWKDDHTACLNNYAYYLCLKGKDLARAEQMSYKTIKAEPDNANHLDTYAWILFLQERYAEAQIYIDQAVKCDTDSVPSAVVLEHAGDICAMNGDVDKAVEYWQQALTAGSENVDIIEQKILFRKYIETE